MDRPSEKHAGDILEVTALDQLQPRRVEWLWPGWVPLGKLTFLEGDPDLGKSTLLLDLAARVTKGWAMPDEAPVIGSEDLPVTKPAGVAILACEDDAADTILPRLLVAEADVSRAFCLGAVSGGPKGSRLVTIPDELLLVRERIVERQCKLLIVDPLTGYLGSRTDSNKDQDVRLALHQLGILAQQTGCAVVFLRHLNKNRGGGNALYSGIGSIAIGAVARSGMTVGKDPSSPERHRVLASVKCNVGLKPRSLRYALEPTDQGACKVAWCGPSDYTAEDLVALPRKAAPEGDDQEAMNKGARAEALLRERARAGLVPCQPFVEEMRRQQIGKSTVERAVKKLGLVLLYPGQTDGKGYCWAWRDDEVTDPFQVRS